MSHDSRRSLFISTNSSDSILATSLGGNIKVGLNTVAVPTEGRSDVLTQRDAPMFEPVVCGSNVGRSVRATSICDAVSHVRALPPELSV